MHMNEITWYAGQWSTSGVPLIGASDHAFWMGSTVFDGARAIGGHLPDLTAHSQRAIRSALVMGMEPKLDHHDIENLVREGLTRLPANADYYIKMLFFCPGGFLLPDPATTAFALHIFEAPMPAADAGFSATVSPYRRPDASMAPTEAKASCLYPNTQRIMREASARGFNSAIVLDSQGDVAEFAVANLWLVRDGVVRTPVPNGTFLNGITRQRVMALLRADGMTVEEVRLRPEEVLAADEVFSTGNHGKVLHCHRIEDRVLPHGPVTKRALALYMDYVLTS